MLKLQNYQESFGSELICPHCGNSHLHHTSVEVFERDEDAVAGTHVVISASTVRQDTNMDGNPSTRRNGILVHLKCEDCDKGSVMTLAQHKGTTLLDIG